MTVGERHFENRELFRALGEHRYYDIAQEYRQIDQLETDLINDLLRLVVRLLSSRAGRRLASPGVFRNEVAATC